MHHNPIIRKWVNDWLWESPNRKTGDMSWKPEYINDVIQMICEFTIASQQPLKQTDNETKGQNSNEYDYDNLHIEIDNAAAELNLDPFEALEVWHIGIEELNRRKILMRKFNNEF